MAEGNGATRGGEAEDVNINAPETPRHSEGNAKPIHEESPLLSASEEEEDDDLIVNDGGLEDDHDEYHDTKSLWYMVLLTISIGGLQLAWSVELAAGTPYLLSLGMSKSLMALVWIAGPLSGALVQPYVGILSDNCRSPWGKRTPFMVAGAVATIVSLLALSWAREIVGGFLSIFGADRASQGVKVSIIVFAVLWVYVLDFAINTGMYFYPIFFLNADLLKYKLALERSY
jgi:solute carrier family 45 protein 1/2/4